MRHPEFGDIHCYLHLIGRLLSWSLQVMCFGFYWMKDVECYVELCVVRIRMVISSLKNSCNSGGESEGKTFQNKGF